MLVHSSKANVDTVHCLHSGLWARCLLCGAWPHAVKVVVGSSVLMLLLAVEQFSSVHQHVALQSGLADSTTISVTWSLVHTVGSPMAGVSGSPMAGVTQ